MGRYGKRLGDAKGAEETQERCRAILETIAPARVKLWPSFGHYYIELRGGGAAWWVYLRHWNHGCIAICIYPGLTMRQAREFFERVRKQEFFELVSRGWKIQPTLALNFRSRFLPTQGNQLSLELVKGRLV